MKKDVIAPTVFFEGDYGGESEKGETYTINPIYALDILDPYATMTFSVKAPSGQYVVALDGTTLKNVPSDKTYQFVVSEYGRYSCSYAYEDSKGNTDDFSYVVSCFDKVQPEIVVEKTAITGKVSEALVIPSYTVSDNYSNAEQIKVYVQIIEPTYNIVSVKEGKPYIPKVAGTYTIRYMVVDENFNIAFIEVSCVVS